MDYSICIEIPVSVPILSPTSYPMRYPVPYRCQYRYRTAVLPRTTAVVYRTGTSTGTVPTEASIAYLVIGANGIVRGKKVTSLARWPPNPSRCWALTWRTIGPMEDYWARSGGLLAE